MVCRLGRSGVVIWVVAPSTAVVADLLEAAVEEVLEFVVEQPDDVDVDVLGAEMIG